jgi:hypothetical protein
VNIGNIHLNISFFFNLFEEKLEADDRQRMPSDGKSSHCLWQGELKIELLH